MISRLEFFRRLGAVRLIDPLLADQYARDEEANWRGTLQMSNRELGWNSSFHASQFPGDDPKPCGRRAMYRLMGIPSEKPFTPESRAYMEAGLDIEERTVQRFQRSGVLLSKTNGAQTNFVSRKYWITGHVDAIIRPPTWYSPHPVEIKTTSNEKIEEMRAGMRTYDPQHRLQLMTYCWFTRRAHTALGFDKLGMTPCQDGSIIYLSRDKPRNTFEFFIHFDPNVINLGLQQIVAWQKLFLTTPNGVLPPRNSTWKWTEQPCKWCDYKKVCKADHNERVRDLDLSNAVVHAMEVKPSYLYREVRIAVLQRWLEKRV
jgi:CRISPR/Cas system-associated exonuclease Cas4 (RecB family)